MMAMINEVNFEKWIGRNKFKKKQKSYRRHHYASQTVITFSSLLFFNLAKLNYHCVLEFCFITPCQFSFKNYFENFPAKPPISHAKPFLKGSQN